MKMLGSSIINRDCEIVAQRVYYNDNCSIECLRVPASVFIWFPSVVFNSDWGRTTFGLFVEDEPGEEEAPSKEIHPDGLQAAGRINSMRAVSRAIDGQFAHQIHKRKPIINTWMT